MTARGEYNTLNVVKRKRVNVEQAKKNFDDLVIFHDLVCRILFFVFSLIFFKLSIYYTVF